MDREISGLNIIKDLKTAQETELEALEGPVTPGWRVIKPRARPQKRRKNGVKQPQNREELGVVLFSQWPDPPRRRYGDEPLNR